MFPKHNIIEENEIAVQNLLGKEIKRIGFAPMFFCEFFQGLEVIQIQSRKTKEYVFGLYWSGRLVGHCYFGDKYTLPDLEKIISHYMPPTLDKMWDYHLEHGDIIWYHKYAQEQYAWIYNRVVSKIQG